MCYAMPGLVCIVGLFYFIFTVFLTNMIFMATQSLGESIPQLKEHIAIDAETKKHKLDMKNMHKVCSLHCHDRYVCFF